MLRSHVLFIICTFLLCSVFSCGPPTNFLDPSMFKFAAKTSRVLLAIMIINIYHLRHF